MEDKKMSSVCRICLAGKTRLHFVKNNLLRSLYEKLTNAKFNSDDARPRVLCSFCYQKLLKCHMFSQMAITSEKLFSHLYDKGLEVTHEYSTEVNMKHHLSVVATMQVIINDGNVTNAVSQVTIKDEPLPSIETQGVTTEPDELVDEDCMKSQVTLDEDNSDHIHVEQTKPENSKMKFSCNSCNKMYKRKSKLVSHIKVSHSQLKGMHYSSSKKQTGSTCMTEDKVIHNLKNKFTCHVCNKTFGYKNSFVRHMRNHTGDKPFACNECDKKFNEKGHIVTHMRKHTGEKPFACNVCDKRYIRKHHLVYHMGTHTGENTIVCNVCSKRFYQKCNFVLHMRTHTGEKPFACNVCDKKFTHKGQLEVHMRMHTGEKPFSCNVCDKQFTQKCALDGHMRIHTGEKPYACNVCDKQFNRKDNLVSHMRIHTGEKPYACNECDKQFNRRDNLVSHMRTHAPQKHKPVSPRGKRLLSSNRI